MKEENISLYINNFSGHFNKSRALCSRFKYWSVELIIWNYVFDGRVESNGFGVVELPTTQESDVSSVCVIFDDSDIC
jgi:hypothetical protein